MVILCHLSNNEEDFASLINKPKFQDVSGSGIRSRLQVGIIARTKFWNDLGIGGKNHRHAKIKNSQQSFVTF